MFEKLNNARKQFLINSFHESADKHLLTRKFSQIDIGFRLAVEEAIKNNSDVKWIKEFKDKVDSSYEEFLKQEPDASEKEKMKFREFKSFVESEYNKAFNKD